MDATDLEVPPISTIVGGTPIIQLEDRSPIWEAQEFTSIVNWPSWSQHSYHIPILRETGSNKDPLGETDHLKFKCINT